MGAMIDGSWRGIEQAARMLTGAVQQVDKAGERIHYRIGTLVKDTAQEYAPISPTTSLLNKARKAAWKKKLKHRARTTSRPSPGGLTRSITFKSTATWARIFVAANAEAGRYAFRIHEEKGATWWKRGLGTVAKGPKADAKFISRAAVDRYDDMKAIVLDETKKLTIVNLTGGT
jgi:hypothetical protein